MATNPLLGEIRILGCNFAPRGWNFCNGQIILIAQNTALFSLLGTQYGGNGTVTFGLPDLRGRTPLNFGTGPGLTERTIGETSGTESVTLTTAQMSQHSHVASTTSTQPCKTGAGNSDSPTLGFPAQNATAEVFSSITDGAMGALTVANTLGTNGGGQSHTNLPPYLCLNFCIAVTGVFPARN